MHGVESSLESLHSALVKSDRASQLLFSPTSAATGDTGSTEDPRSASLSLANSVAGHASVDGSSASDEFDDARGSDEEVGYSTPSPSSRRVLSPNIGSRAPSKRDFTPSVAESDSSWSRLSSSINRGREQSPFIVPVVEHEDSVYIKEEECSDDGREALRSSTEEMEGEGESHREGYCLPITNSQAEAAECALRAMRRSPHFDRWLHDTWIHARGDGESTIDSDDVYPSIAAVTRETNLVEASSLACSQVPLPSRCSSSGLSSSTSSASLVEPPMLGSDTIPIKLEATENFEVVPREETPSAPIVVEKVEDQSSAPLSLPAPTAADCRWKVASAVLALGWLLSTAYPRLPPFTSVFHRRQPPEVIAAAVNSSTLIHIAEFSQPDLSLGSSLTLHVTPILVLLAALILYQRLYSDEEDEPIKRSRSRSPSPLFELNPSSIEEARSLLPAAIANYHSNRLIAAIDAFTVVSNLACAPADKASACEWLGRAQYRLARITGERQGMEYAVKSFERAVRMDGSSATARASLGRAKFRLGEVEGGVKILLGAVKKDGQIAYAHEYLGKAYAQLDMRWTLAEKHLRLAISLDSTSYSALAFLGEQLHIRGRTMEARTLLEQAVVLRVDYPAAHARLGFIATEQMDSARAVKHLELVKSTRDTGFIDDDLLPPTTTSLLGPTPFLSLFFAIPSSDPSARLAILDRATKLYPSHTLLSILNAISRRRSHASPVRTCLDTLGKLESVLAKRVERFGPSDLDGRGLWALCLLGMNRAKQARAVYSEFWTGMRKGAQAEERELAFLVMAFNDLQSTRRA